MRSKHKRKAGYRATTLGAILRFPFEHPILFLLIVLVLLSGFMVLVNRRQTTSSKIAVNRENSSHTNIIGLIQRRCQTQPFKVANKLTGLRVDFHEGNFHPAICVQDLKTKGVYSDNCKDLIAARQRFINGDRVRTNRIELDKMRVLVDEQIKSEILQSADEFEKIKQSLTPTQRAKFANFDTALLLLRKAQLLSSHCKEIDLAACGEHAFTAFYDIAKFVMEQRTKVKLTYITTRKNANSGHDFVAICNEGGEKEINNNRTATSNFLRNIKGYLCDPWNEGYFRKTSDNVNKVYYEWDSVKTYDVLVDFDHSDLPAHAREHIDKRLAMLGLQELTKPAASVFCR